MTQFGCRKVRDATIDQASEERSPLSVRIATPSGVISHKSDLIDAENLLLVLIYVVPEPPTEIMV